MMVRYATRDDVAGALGGIPSTMRAIVVEDQGKVLGVAGVARMRDHMQAFGNISDSVLRAHPYMMAKAAVMLRQMLSDVGGSVIAVCSRDEPTAPALLARLGFAPINDSGVWQWQP